MLLQVAFTAHLYLSLSLFLGFAVHICSATGKVLLMQLMRIHDGVQSCRLWMLAAVAACRLDALGNLALGHGDWIHGICKRSLYKMRS